MYFGKSIHWVGAIFVIYVTIKLSIRYVVTYRTEVNIYFRRSTQQQNPQQFDLIRIDDAKAKYILIKIESLEVPLLLPFIPSFIRKFQNEAISVA